jgi:hypothetical protein
MTGPYVEVANECASSKQKRYLDPDGCGSGADLLNVAVSTRVLCACDAKSIRLDAKRFRKRLLFMLTT